MLSDAPTAFFSYSREDSEFALRIAKDLRAAGAAIWIDQLDIDPGERWDTAVEVALHKCSSVLLILSPNSVASDNVLDEVSFGLEQKKEIIPVLYRDCEIPFRIRRFQRLDFRSSYETMLPRLVAKLSAKVQSSKEDDAHEGSPVEVYAAPEKNTSWLTKRWIRVAVPVVILSIATGGGLYISRSHAKKEAAATGHPASNKGTSVPVNTPIETIQPPPLLKPSERPMGATTITFQNLAEDNGSVFTRYSEHGFTVRSESGKWLVAKGGQSPYIYFLLPRVPNSEARAKVLLTSANRAFSFSSADFYASITKIPYVLTGKMGGDTVFLQSGIVPNTYGNFATIGVEDRYKNITMDRLEIELSTYTEYALGNPVGVSNIVLLVKQ